MDHASPFLEGEGAPAEEWGGAGGGMVINYAMRDMIFRTKLLPMARCLLYHMRDTVHLIDAHTRTFSWSEWALSLYNTPQSNLLIKQEQTAVPYRICF